MKSAVVIILISIAPGTNLRRAIADANVVLSDAEVVTNLGSEEVLTVSSNGNHALLSRGNGKWAVARITADSNILPFTEEEMKWSTCTFNSDSSHFAYVRGRNEVVVRAVADARISASRSVDCEPRCCTFGRDLQWPMLACDGAIMVPDAGSGRFVIIPSGQSASSNRIAVDPSGELIASSSPWSQRPVVLVDLIVRERVRDLEGMSVVHVKNSNGMRVRRSQNADTAIDVAFSSDGDQLAAVVIPTASAGASEIWHWEIGSGRLIRRDRIANARLRRLAYLDNNHDWVVAVGSDDTPQRSGDSVLLINTASGNVADRRDCAGRFSFLGVVEAPGARRILLWENLEGAGNNRTISIGVRKPVQ